MPVARDPDTHQPEVALGGIVIEEGNRVVRRGLIAQNCSDDLDATVAGAEDQQRDGVAARAAFQAVDP